MSSVHLPPTNGKLSSAWNPWLPPDPNQNYSSVQNRAQISSEALYRYNTIGKLLVDAMKRYVIGKGLTPMSAPEVSFLKWAPERVIEFQKQAEAYWRLVTDTTDYDYYGKDTFKQLQSIALTGILVDGDILTHWGYRRLHNGSVAPYMQLISGRMVTQGYEQDTKSSTGGVVIDPATGKETGYKLRLMTDDRMDTWDTFTVKRFNTLGRKEFDLLTLQKSDPSLVRGVPILTTLRDDIFDFNQYKSYHLLQCAVQSLFTAFIEHEKDAPETNIPFNDLLAGAGGSETIESNGDEKITLGPGLVMELAGGYHVNLVQRQAQGEDFDAYSKSVIGLMASTLGMSYEVVMNAYNASFSASRASINGAEKNFSIIRDEFAKKFCEPTWEQIIEHGILSGAIDCPEWSDLDRYGRKALLASTWTGVTAPQVDPTKEVTAYKTAVEAGFCSREYAVRQLFGLDFEEVAERLGIEKGIVDGLGIGGTQEEQQAPPAEDRVDDSDTEDESTLENKE